jgi:hypothetical protein
MLASGGLEIRFASLETAVLLPTAHMYYTVFMDKCVHCRRLLLYLRHSCAIVPLGRNMQAAVGFNTRHPPRVRLDQSFAA